MAEAIQAGGPHAQMRIFGKPEVHGERRMGVMLARGANVEEALDKAKLMRSTIKATVL